jgi:hypothetical protein
MMLLQLQWLKCCMMQLQLLPECFCFWIPVVAAGKHNIMQCTNRDRQSRTIDIKCCNQRVLLLHLHCLLQLYRRQVRRPWQKQDMAVWAQQGRLHRACSCWHDQQLWHCAQDLAEGRTGCRKSTRAAATSI